MIPFRLEAFDKRFNNYCGTIVNNQTVLHPMKTLFFCLIALQTVITIDLTQLCAQNFRAEAKIDTTRQRVLIRIIDTSNSEITKQRASIPISEASKSARAILKNINQGTTFFLAENPDNLDFQNLPAIRSKYWEITTTTANTIIKSSKGTTVQSRKNVSQDTLYELHIFFPINDVSTPFFKKLFDSLAYKQQKPAILAIYGGSLPITYIPAQDTQLREFLNHPAKPESSSQYQYWMVIILHILLFIGIVVLIFAIVYIYFFYLWDNELKKYFIRIWKHISPAQKHLLRQLRQVQDQFTFIKNQSGRSVDSKFVDEINADLVEFVKDNKRLIQWSDIRRLEAAVLKIMPGEMLLLHTAATIKEYEEVFLENSSQFKNRNTDQERSIINLVQQEFDKLRVCLTIRKDVLCILETLRKKLSITSDKYYSLIESKSKLQEELKKTEKSPEEIEKITKSLEELEKTEKSLINEFREALTVVKERYTKLPFSNQDNYKKLVDQIIGLLNILDDQQTSDSKKIQDIIEQIPNYISAWEHDIAGCACSEERFQQLREGLILLYTQSTHVLISRDLRFNQRASIAVLHAVIIFIALFVLIVVPFARNSAIITAFIFGMFGAAFSTQQRIFKAEIEAERWLRSFTGSIWPVLNIIVSSVFGGLAGILLLIILNTGFFTKEFISYSADSFYQSSLERFFQITPTTYKDAALHLVASFLSGFSERLLPDALERLEKVSQQAQKIGVK